jgi:hypothetical protein
MHSLFKELPLLILTFCIQSFNTEAQIIKNQKFTFSTLGDMPYFLPEDFPRFENVIKGINKAPIAFSVHVGDFKSSSTPCSDEAFNKILGYFETFKKPLIYTPGDNEWTDCHKKEAGAFSPEERLETLRKLYFKSPQSFGQEKMALIPESYLPAFKKYVENTRWDYGNIAFATFHAIGSNNNFLPTNTTTFNQEFYERDAANVAWIKETFKHAKEAQLAGIVFFTQADMFGEKKDLKEASGFINILKTLQEESIAFGKPVLLVNGDSHEYIVDKPILADKKTKNTLLNFTRLQVFGELDMHTVMVTVNPENPNLFEINPYLIEGN